MPEAARLIGDDAAKIAGREELAITMDTQTEGVHFFPGFAPAMLAERALAVNLSDLAAMGAAPRYVFLSLGAPPEFDRRAFFRAFLRAVQASGALLAGGDLSRTREKHVVITLLGARQKRFLERSGARPGDVLYLGGEIGVSALGFELLRQGAAFTRNGAAPPEFLEKNFLPAARHALARHLLPRPQLALGTELARDHAAGGALDVSDGLARDLHRLCRESGVGAEVRAEDLPMPPAARRLAARLGRSWLELALGGGEDYVLLFTLPAADAPPAGATAIGNIVAGRRVTLLADGRRRALPPFGFDHLAGA